MATTGVLISRDQTSGFSPFIRAIHNSREARNNVCQPTKLNAARAAMEHIEYDWVVGVGTGSTANHFIDVLAESKERIDGAVASSETSAQRLGEHGIRVLGWTNG